MKIFNWPWVHGKFYRKATEYSKKLASTEKEYCSLVEDVSCTMSVLAIGTFGFDCHPISHLNQEQCGDYICINDDDDDEALFEAKPLLNISEAITCSDFDESPDHHSHCDKIGSQKRVTLADLLSADSAYADSNDDVINITNYSKNKDDDDDNYYEKKTNNVVMINEKESSKKRIMSSLTITKKLIPDQLKAKDKKKVHHKVMKLMTRMMKRKIHPDSDPDGNKNDIIAACSS